MFASVPRLLFTCWLLLSGATLQEVFGQYYLTGSTADSSGKPIPFVQIKLKSNGVIYQSGSSGGFGLPSSKKTDSVTCYLEGYDTLRTTITTGAANALTLFRSKNFIVEIAPGNQLASLTKNLLKDPSYISLNLGESYREVIENGFVNTATYPNTGFGPNPNNAAYSNIRRFIANESVVPPDAVRSEELLNYFALSTAPPPPPNQLLEIQTNISSCPWNSRNMLLFISMQAQKLNLENVPPANLVFLIDNSASMDMPNRLPLLQTGFKMLVKNLRDIDKVAIVTYGGTAMIALPPTSGGEKEKIIKAINEIEAGGATPGSNGIQLAYQLAMANPIPNGNNRVILATDGDFNIGITAEKELEAMIESYKQTGIYLTCLGVGMGNYKDSKIETLARHGNGNFAYLDKEQEAEKVLVKELTQNLYSVASNVTIHLELNPSLIKQYRLIGYDNRKGAVQDASSYLLGMEIGSGSSMVSMLEIEPVDTSAEWKKKTMNAIAGSISVNGVNSKTNQPITMAPESIPFNYQRFAELDQRLRLATSLSMFGSLLRKSPIASTMSFSQASEIANLSIDRNDALQAEYLSLIETANGIYYPDKKKKGKK